MTNFLKPYPANSNPLKNQEIGAVCKLAESANCNLYIVGGFIRDSIRPKVFKKTSHLDIDFAVEKIDATDFARTVAEKMNGHFVLLDNKNDTARVVLDSGTYLDFAGCVGGTIDTDIERRDFSINALAWSDKNPEQIIDKTGGLEDLQSGVIRVIKEKNIIDDPLRLLRAFRFAIEFGFEIEPETLSKIGKHASLISKVPFERINYELFLLMEAPRVFNTLETMGSCGLLEEIFPELKATRKVTANQFHHLGLFEHSLECVNKAELYMDGAFDWVKKSAEGELAYGISRLSATKVACLLHDIGKPQTWQVTDEGRHTFYGHEKVGYEMVQELAMRCKWAKPVNRLVANLVKWHLRPGQLFHQQEPTPRAVNRFYRNIGADVPELMILAFGDLGATKGDGFDQQVRQSLKDSFVDLLSGYKEFVEKEKTAPRFIDGNRLMQLLDLPPGPRIGKILEALEEAQSLGEVTDIQSAENFVSDLYRKSESN